MKAKTYERCEFIIRQFMSVEKPTAELLARFHDWLLDDHCCREKNVAIRKVFYEALSDINPTHEHAAKNSVSQNQFLNELFAVQKVE